MKQVPTTSKQDDEMPSHDDMLLDDQDIPTLEEAILESYGEDNIDIFIGVSMVIIIVGNC